ncbi:late embryogenesis abundant protein 6-like [Mangifera indica]|uniref:late embryogenesis abundant protein 6-like n=1 Tax=Mangifera indica TaxID=29780 RepID=UPI001CFADE27|nr:late embryogenesis abundant protein 6-like [Mangifera indica]
MQAVKEKLQDVSALRKAKAEAKAHEKAEKEMAKARMEIAHETRLAREAEAKMELHVAKAGMMADRETAKQGSDNATNSLSDVTVSPPTATP